jgi:hypothetical protein
MVYSELPLLKKNAVRTTIAAPGIDASTATIPVTELSKFYNKDGVLIIKGIVIGFLNADDNLTEEITITGASGTSGAGNLTGATRGVNADGSIGAGHAWDAGTEIAVMFSTGIYNQIRDDLIAAVGTWDTFPATPTWPGTTPTISSTVARYVRNGNVVTFGISYIFSDGNGAALPTIALPVSAPQIANYQVPLTAFKKYVTGGSSSMSDPFAFIDFTLATPVIKFNQPGILPSGSTAVLNISGTYEVA